MIAVYLNCLYIGENLSTRPYFKNHFFNFSELLKGQKKTPCIAQQEIFDISTEEQIKKFDAYPIPLAFENEFIEQFPSVKHAWLALLSDEQDKYINFLQNQFELIEKDYEEPIEAILTYLYSPSLHAACKKKNIRVYEFEWSPFRSPHSLHSNLALGYFMEENKFSTMESDRRYEKFKEYKTRIPFELFSRKELMALVLSEQMMHLLYDYGNGNQYDLGVVLSREDDSYQQVWAPGWENDKLLKAAKNVFKNSVLVRTHPLYCVKSMDDFDVDTSSTSLEFIHCCKRIESVISNVGFEAMLLGKTSYVLGGMPFAQGAVRSICQDEDMVSSAEYLNFIIFCIFVPFQLMHDVDYIRWRLSDPPEDEIFKRHLEFSFNTLKLPLEIIDEKEDRLNKILSARGLLPYHYNKRVTSMTEDEKWVKRQLAARDQEIFELEVKLAKLKNAQAKKDGTIQ